MENQSKQSKDLKGEFKVWTVGNDTLHITKDKSNLIRCTVNISGEFTIFHLDFPDQKERDGIYKTFPFEQVLDIFEFFKNE